MAVHPPEIADLANDTTGDIAVLDTSLQEPSSTDSNSFRVPGWPFGRSGLTPALFSIIRTLPAFRVIRLGTLNWRMGYPSIGVSSYSNAPDPWMELYRYEIPSSEPLVDSKAEQRRKALVQARKRVLAQGAAIDAAREQRIREEAAEDEWLRRDG